jgi:hypothetical protein
MNTAHGPQFDRRVADYGAKMISREESASI